MPFTLILLLLLLPLATFADFSKGDCMTCVKQGCTYCKGEEFFENPSICVCEEFTGFFGSCSDHTFGGHHLTSKLDCTFNSTQGEKILAVIVTVSILVVLCLGCCCFFCNPFKEGGFCECCCRMEPSDGGHNPAYTFGNAAPAYTTGHDHVTHAFPIATANAIPLSGNEAYASSNPADTTTWSAPPAYVPSDPSPSAPPGDSGCGGGTSTFDQLSSGI
ncbi:predicted protein [Chaetoceros tenuissimus]|uniref:Uncharacterized protein n=1 Tax=Chaetoceros tenuissimus TaxID=426638 RepID=A0AAD3GZJ9_9STRA|nr:predicted protein [Chaetoceros tenuissimus]